ncbi:hypothetical protein [Streptomyces hydrogenans]|uniref:hypothetical protein n=1 Tax=Streptomyces hydrogenans TaxID=1873719 RepID=UPI0036EA9CA6
MLTATIAVTALTAGYVLGRARLGHRASNWAHWLRYGPHYTRQNWRWWAAQPVFAVEIAALLIAHPVRTATAWRHRNDPPPPRSPAPHIRRVTPTVEEPTP